MGPQASQAQAGPQQGQAGPTQRNPYQPVIAPPGPSQVVQGTQVHPMSLPPMTWQDRVNFGQDTMSGGTQQYTQAGNAPYQGPYPGQNQGPTQTQALGGTCTSILWVSQEESATQVFQGVSMNQNVQGINGNWGAQAQIRAVNVPQVTPVRLLFSPLMQMLSNNLKPPMLEKDHFMDFKLKFPTVLD